MKKISEYLDLVRRDQESRQSAFEALRALHDQAAASGINRPCVLDYAAMNMKAIPSITR